MYVCMRVCVCVLPNHNILFIAGICPITLISSDFYLITQSKSYSDAKTHCRDFYGDLATVHNLSDMNNLISLPSNVTIRAWIGLKNGRVWIWHSPIRNHRITVEMGVRRWTERGEWFDSDCTARRSFICQGEWPHAGIWVHLNAEIETSLCVSTPQASTGLMCTHLSLKPNHRETLRFTAGTFWSGQHTLSRGESGYAESVGLAKCVDWPF